MNAKSLTDLHTQLGAELAPDGIPYHYGDQESEYQAALQVAVLLDRSHEGRIIVTGASRHAFLDRMSTNKINDLAVGEGRPTIFTNATGRIIDRVVVYNHGDHLLLLTGPGRSGPVRDYLSRQIFFGDEIAIKDITQSSAQFAVHGPLATNFISSVFPEDISDNRLRSYSVALGNTDVTLLRQKQVIGDHWVMIVPKEHASDAFSELHRLGRSIGLRPAGSLIYNLIRVRAGHPARGELNEEYIPLEIGLFDEISFSKGCYTGQEIIARMESREKLARIIVRVKLSEFVSVPCDVYSNSQKVGVITSCASAPDGTVYGLATIKYDLKKPGTPLTIADVDAHVLGHAGIPPSFVTTASTKTE